MLGMSNHKVSLPVIGRLSVFWVSIRLISVNILRMLDENSLACTIYNAIIIFENTIAVYQMLGLIQILKSDGIPIE